jgi:hypothetical protein
MDRHASAASTGGFDSQHPMPKKRWILQQSYNEGFKNRLSLSRAVV